jgi:hypothetical protein
MRKYIISTEFTDTPGPRYRHEGDKSGQEFREDILLPMIRANEKILIDLDGVEGYGSSFLEEAFGGLVRENMIKGADVLRMFEFKSEEEPTYIEQIIGYVNDAIAGDASVRNDK